MIWNNDKLNEIQQIEYDLINSINCGSNSNLFTNFIHSTSEWIDKEHNAKKIHISPFKAELDKQVELVAYHIECGLRTDDAIASIGTNASDFRKKLNDTHRLILLAARKKRLHNKKY
jgi:hypothetical protein